MSISYNGKETAKIIRQELKTKFPKTKFSVRSDYNSVRIEWFDGASFQAVEEFTSQFQGKHFNGMIDLEERITTTWNNQEVCFNVYVSCYRNLSPEFAQKILAYCIDKYIDHDYLNICAVTIDTNTYEGKTYASFNGTACKEHDCYQEGSVDLIRKTHRAIAVDDTLNWAKDSAIFKAKEQAEIDEIERKNAAQQTFIDQQVCDLPEIEAGGIIIDDLAYRLVGNEPVVYGKGTDENPYGVRYWNYLFEGADEKIISLDLDTVDNIINPIIPLDIVPCDIRVRGKFASLNKNDSIRDYESLCKEPSHYLENNEKHRNWYFDQCRVVERITLTPEDYDRFSESLLTDRDWLKGKGGGNTDAEGLPNKPFHQLTEAQRELWQAQSYMICLAVMADDRKTILVDPEGYSYAKYVALVDQSINEELIQLKAPHKSVVHLPEYFESETETLTLDNLYKAWIQELIESNRLTEIIAFQAWRNTYGQTILEQQYTTFVRQCLEDDAYSNIVSFDNWVITAY